MEEYPLLLAVDGAVKAAAFLKAGLCEFRAGNRLPLFGKDQLRLLAQHRITEIAVIDLHDLFRSGRQVGQFILHRDLRPVDRNADRPLQLQDMPEQGGLPYGSTDSDFVPFRFRADLFRRQAVITAVHGLPFPVVVPVARACRSEAAGIKEPAREGIQEFTLIRRDHGRAVIAVFAHPGHIDSFIPGLTDIKTRVRQNIQLKASGRAYLDDLRSPGLPLRRCEPAQGIKLAGISDVSFSLFFQHCLVSPYLCGGPA